MNKLLTELNKQDLYIFSEICAIPVARLQDIVTGKPIAISERIILKAHLGIAENE